MNLGTNDARPGPSGLDRHHILDQSITIHDTEARLVEQRVDRTVDNPDHRLECLQALGLAPYDAATYRQGSRR